MGKTIALTNHKGGVGKTTSTVNIGAGLSTGKQGKRVLLIDLDPQASLTTSLGVNDADFTIYGALRGEYPLKPIEITPKLHIIAAEKDLAGAELELSTEAGREFILRELIEPIKNQYDYILIDCPPSLGLLTVNAFVASDEIYIPAIAEFLAIKGLAEIVDVMNKVKKRLNKNLELGGILVTRFDARKIMNRDAAESVESAFKDKVFKTRIRDNIAVAEAPSSGLDIFRYNSGSHGAADYLNLCKEITQGN